MFSESEVYGLCYRCIIWGWAVCGQLLSFLISCGCLWWSLVCCKEKLSLWRRRATLTCWGKIISRYWLRKVTIAGCPLRSGTYQSLTVGWVYTFRHKFLPPAWVWSLIGEDGTRQSFSASLMARHPCHLWKCNSVFIISATTVCLH